MRLEEFIDRYCIKNLNFNKQPSSMTLSMTALINKEDIPEEIIVGNTYILKLKNVSGFSYTKNISYTLTFKPYIIGTTYFKVINKNILTASEKYKQIDKFFANISTVDQPTNIFLKVTEDFDVYGEYTGFTPYEIFSAFNLIVYYPSRLDYFITELKIPNGTNVSALIKTIFPFPIKINFIANDIIEVKIKKEYIHFYNICSENVTSEIKYYNTTFTGLPSSLRNVIPNLTNDSIYTKISDGDDTTFGEELNTETANELISVEYDVIKNDLGKIYSIPYEKTVVKKYVKPNF